MKVHVRFMKNVYGVAQTKRSKGYKTMGIAKRYIKEWLNQPGDTFCEVIGEQNNASIHGTLG